MARKPAPTIADQRALDPAVLRMISDPVRSFVVYSLVPQAKTVKQLAAELGCPATRLYYHVQQLQKHGLIFVEKSRRVSGILERHYRATAREFVLDRGSFLDKRGRIDRRRFDALLAFVFDQTRQDIQRRVAENAIDLSLRAPDPRSVIAYRNVLRLTDEQAARLYQRLLDFWMEYDAAAKAPPAEGRFYAFTVALYPNAIGAESSD